MAANIKVIGGGGASAAPDDARIDPRAVVYPNAQIGAGCVVGPFAVIGPDVTLGPQCIVHAHAVVQGPSIFGAENVIHSFACIGGPPQDLRYRGETTSLVVGSYNEFREHVTVNRGTVHGGGVTTIGDNNLLMAYSHVAHDCTLGNRVVMANHATLAGHVVVDDYVVFGGMVAVGAFLRIGESAMLAAGAMVEREAPPFCTVAGDRARLCSVNRVGLDRRGIRGEARTQIREICRALRDRGYPLSKIISDFECREELTSEAHRMLDFLQKVTRGIAR